MSAANESPSLSGHNLYRSRWAARLSVVSMLNGSDGSLFDAPHRAFSRFVYLTTLTFADPEPSYAEGRLRLANFIRGYLEREKWFGLAVPEFGKRTGRLHFHLVSTERLSAKELWAVCPKYGFGRPDVRVRPAWREGKVGEEIHPAAWYLAKYVGKRQGWPAELKGMRQWSVIGKKFWPCEPVRTRDVRITRKVLTSTGERWKVLPYLVTRESLCDNAQFLRIPEGTRQIAGQNKMREITEKEKARIITEVLAGAAVTVGDYRFGETVEREYSSFKDSSVKVKRRSAVHQVDVGPKCERLEITEQIPEGANLATFSLPAKTGDLVMVIVEGISKYTGGTTYRGRVVKL